MTLNDVALASRALVRIGASPITSFTDGSNEAEIANALYEPVTNAILSSYAWSFATKQVELVQLVTDPVADYTYAFQLPNDFLRALSAGAGSRGRGVEYRLYENTLQSNASKVVLTYVFKPDEATFPPYFDMALITRLAAEFTIPVTENTSRGEAMFRMAEKEFEHARQIDAQSDTPNRIENFTLTDIRG